MRNGLYKANFNTPNNAGAGVITLHDGKLSGGDSSLFYLGTFSLNDNQVTAEVKTDRHTTVPGIASVFGIDRVHISLIGTSSGDVVKLTGKAKEAPGMSFSVTLTRIGD